MNDIISRLFDVDKWVGEDILFLNRKDGLIYKSINPLTVSSSNLKFYSFIQLSLDIYSIYTAVEKHDLKYYRKLNRKEEIAFNAKKMLLTKCQHMKK